MRCRCCILRAIDAKVTNSYRLFLSWNTLLIPAQIRRKAFQSPKCGCGSATPWNHETNNGLDKPVIQPYPSAVTRCVTQLSGMGPAYAQQLLLRRTFPEV
jgi:hypothetical protein